MPRTVILVDELNRPLGTADLLEAHTGAGQLHRAFSAYVFRRQRSELLIQQRSEQKMLWAGIWANTCCSHPLENEDTVPAGQRRLMEELGFRVNLVPAGQFVYRAEDPNGHGVEHEHVTVLVGDAPDDVTVRPDPGEVAAWQWVAVEELRRDMLAQPGRYAPWFHIGFTRLSSS